MEGERRWLGPVPTRCDTCRAPIKSVFYDMATRMGPWGNMCPLCALNGVGIGRAGPGLGQKYELRQRGGKEAWVKTEG